MPDFANDLFHLSRFESAQVGVYPQALSELRSGKKLSHWMWFIFPQIYGLGSSKPARFYAIRSREEAEAYLGHPLLGERLNECCTAILQVEAISALEIFGDPDYLKLKSSMTLFSAIAGPGSIYEKLLAKFYGGQPDQRTLKRLP